MCRLEGKYSITVPIWKSLLRLYEDNSQACRWWLTAFSVPGVDVGVNCCIISSLDAHRCTLNLWNRSYRFSACGCIISLRFQQRKLRECLQSVSWVWCKMSCIYLLSEFIFSVHWSTWLSSVIHLYIFTAMSEWAHVWTCLCDCVCVRVCVSVHTHSLTVLSEVFMIDLPR